MRGMAVCLSTLAVILTLPGEKAKLQCVLNKAVRHGFLTNYKPVEYLFESSDTTLFSAILRHPDHVLHPLLPPLKTTGYHLRISAAMV